MPTLTEKCNDVMLENRQFEYSRTFGEKLAGVGSNPSGDALADVVKQSHADLMDHLEQERQDASDRGETLKAELLSAAIQAQLNAKLLSVNAILFN